ncbi:MAG: glyoxalase, partial [Betaproteobacteria bacterium HGW-Betaproteobacteria-13]
PLKGLTWIYFMSPWGMQLELVSAPDGRAYELTTSERLWDPRK